MQRVEKEAREVVEPTTTMAQRDSLLSDYILFLPDHHAISHISVLVTWAKLRI
jgi:hypothetical protein